MESPTVAPTVESSYTSRGRHALIAALTTLAALAWFGPYYSLSLLRLIDDWSTLPIADDAFYFLQIARHMADGNGPTFDGVHPTSGFQPLWQYVLAALQWTMSFSPNGLVRAAFFLANIALLATAWQAVQLLRAFSVERRDAILIGIALVVWAPCATSYFTLCESSLNGLLLVVVLRCAIPVLRGDASNAHQYGLGALLGLLFLARLDNFLFAAVLGVTVLALHRRRGIPPLLRIAATLGPIGLGYAASNLLQFGHLMPISGAMKNQWSGPILWTDPTWWAERIQDRLFWFFSTQSLVDNTQHIARALAIVTLIITIVPFRMVFLQRRGERPAAAEVVLWCALLSFVPKHLYYALCQGYHNQALWYFAPEMLVLVIALGAMARHPAGLVALAVAMVVTAWPNGIGDAIANWWLPTWSWLPALVLLGAAGVVLVIPRNVAPHRRAVAALPVILALLALPERQILWCTPLYRTEKSRLAELGRWVKDVDLARYGTIGAYSAGLVNYFAGGHVTNLDGLVADWEWFGMQQKTGRFPPPRGETFVLDYHPVTRQRLLDNGYELCLDVLPDYQRSAFRKDFVFGVTNDREAAVQLYRDLLARPDTDPLLTRHSRGVVRRLQLAPAPAAAPR